ncbi:MAG: hypothetical protein ACYS74_17910 [Planctomycetota bacterium]|jgi:hypothetical protein
MKKYDQEADAFGTAGLFLLIVAACVTAAHGQVQWQRRSSSTGDMPVRLRGGRADTSPVGGMVQVQRQDLGPVRD